MTPDDNPGYGRLMEPEQLLYGTRPCQAGPAIDHDRARSAIEFGVWRSWQGFRYRDAVSDFSIQAAGSTRWSLIDQLNNPAAIWTFPNSTVMTIISHFITVSALTQTFIYDPNPIPVHSKTSQPGRARITRTGNQVKIRINDGAIGQLHTATLTCSVGISRVVISDLRYLNHCSGGNQDRLRKLVADYAT